MPARPQQKPSWPTVRLCRTDILHQVEQAWPDKRFVAVSLANEADRLIMGFPQTPRRVLISLLAGFGARIGIATKPEACVDEFLELMKHLSCPEPGWDAATLEIVD